MKILYLHGWHSVRGGVKPTFLAQHGMADPEPLATMLEACGGRAE
jgi:hypothetical protein